MFNVDYNFILPHWLYWGGLLFFPLVVMLAVRKSQARQATVAANEPLSSEEIQERILQELHGQDATPHVENCITRIIDGLSTFTGIFVAYWTVIAVVAYFYEVIVRYLFNSPTNWVHESMFLMFGMQYLIAGAYAFMHDAHVRVDLLYSKTGVRGKAALDIFTFVFFLIFALALLWTGWTFFSNSVSSQFLPLIGTGYTNELSFTEWQVDYWPVKGTIVLGAALLLVQGVGRLVKDIMVLRRTSKEGEHA